MIQHGKFLHGRYNPKSMDSICQKCLLSLPEVDWYCKLCWATNY